MSPSSVHPLGSLTITSSNSGRRTSMITLPSSPTPVGTKGEAPRPRCSSLKAPRRASSTHSSPVSLWDPRAMLSKINTSVHSPERPPRRRPHGPRSAITPPVTPAKGENRSPTAGVRKTKAGPSTQRTSPPQTSLPYDADAEQDPLFSILCDQAISRAPRCYRLKVIDLEPSTSDDENVLESLFSFTVSPVQSPSYSATSFHARHTHRPAPLALPLPSPSLLSPATANVVVEEYGAGDKVDRWIHSRGMEPMPTPMLVEDSPHESWDNGGQSDWREVIDRFLQHGLEDGEADDPQFPPTPVGERHDGHASFLQC